jgi:hypothetical protein
MHPSTISGINRLPYQEKQAIFSRLIPGELIDRFQIPQDWQDESGNKLLKIYSPDGSSTAEMELRHIHDFPDPVLYGHITDTLNGQIHVLLYILNDPDSPRFNVDRLPDGTPTQFGTLHRNIEAELAAMQYGLAPGQVRQGLHMLKPAIHGFEVFVSSLGHDLFFAEPLYYHNAVLFERNGFAYSKGRKLMERIQSGFSPGGELLQGLNDSTPFRTPKAAKSIRMRSWAIHDGILGEPFTNVTMYKRIGKSAGVSTCDGCAW